MTAYREPLAVVSSSAGVVNWVFRCIAVRPRAHAIEMIPRHVIGTRAHVRGARFTHHESSGSGNVRLPGISHPICVSRWALSSACRYICGPLWSRCYISLQRFRLQIACPFTIDRTPSNASATNSLEALVTLTFGSILAPASVRRPPLRDVAADNQPQPGMTFPVTAHVDRRFASSDLPTRPTRTGLFAEQSNSVPVGGAPIVDIRPIALPCVQTVNTSAALVRV